MLVSDFASELARKLDAVEQIDPVALAELFRNACGVDEDSTALRHVLQNFLLVRTIEHARHHTLYYQSAPYRDWAPDISDGAPNLDCLPLLQREAVVDHFDEFLADDVTLRSICHTSGSTGTPLDVYKSHEEIGFIHAYYQQMFQPLIALLERRPLVLTLPNVYHGVPVPMPGIGMTLVSGVTDDIQIKDACRLLQARFKVKGHDDSITILSGLSVHVLFLTNYLMEQGINPRDLGLTSVTSTGGFLPRIWIDFLKNAWGCIVNDRFTLTEAIGGASRVDGTDTFELDSHLVGEIVDLDTERQSNAPVGLLALTNLYPFVQMQPLIRYTIGDLVRHVPGSGPLRFQFLGKAKNCVSWRPAGRREWLLFSATLNELLHELPDCNVCEWFSNVRSAVDRSFGSQPIVSIDSTEEHGRVDIRISIELRYAPHTRPARLDELRQKITKALRATPDTALAFRMDRNEVSVSILFFGPGNLNAPLVVKI